MNLTVNDKISNEIYEKLKKIENLFFEFGEITYFSKNDIDNGQKGFRYNAHDNTIIKEWAGDEYVIIGYDTTRGFGPDPIIMKVDEKDLPIYYLMTDSGDWKNPTKIADSFDDYIEIMDYISEFYDYLSDSTLSEENYDLLIDKILKINSNKNIDYWENLLYSAVQ